MKGCKKKFFFVGMIEGLQRRERDFKFQRKSEYFFVYFERIENSLFYIY